MGIILFILSILFVNNAVLAQNSIGLASVGSDAHNREKIYLHLDKSYYNVGENIWFKIYLINAKSYVPEAINEVVYVDLISPLNEIVSSKIIKTFEGFGEGDYKLPNNLVKGVYNVRAYTNYMRNFDSGYFFRKEIFVNSMYTTTGERQISSLKEGANSNPSNIRSKSRPDLQFFPEGGYMVNGILSQIGFKAVGESGKGIDLKGEIVDVNNHKILEFKSSRLGMGKFSLIPESGKAYGANIIYKGSVFSYDLPPALNNGVTLQIVDFKEYYQANLRSSSFDGLKNLKLIGKQRNGIIFSSNIVGSKSKALVKIPKNILQDGIIQFTLLDDNDEPLAERLVFFESGNHMPTVQISPSKEHFGKRELVKLQISLDTLSQVKTKAYMSMAVADVSAIQPDDYNLDIKSQLLLDSEIKGNIEQPGYYFYSKDPKRRENLDILMITQGWRKYRLDNPIAQHGSNSKYEHETGVKITGKVKSYLNPSKPVIAEVHLSYKNKAAIGFDKTITDNHGRFIFRNLDFKDSTNVLLQASEFNKKAGVRKATSSNDLLIELDSIAPPEITFQRPFANQSKTDISNEFATKVNKTLNLFPMSMNQKGLIKLEEVEVTSQKKEAKNRYEKRRFLYKEPSYTVDFENLRIIPYRSVLTAIRGRIPSTILRGASTLTGDTSPLYLLDGMPVQIETINSIPIFDIDFVDVLVGYKAAIYGSKAGNGVIAVYTRQVSNKSNNQKGVPGTISFIHPGFYEARKFYTPVYKLANASRNKPDFRNTIYWNPEIKMQGQNKTKISFFTTDTAATYKVTLEGISSEGVPIVSGLFIEVN